MIYSITLNPAIDRSIEIPNFRVGQTFKASSSVVFYAGKGVNVAITLKEIGQAAEIIAFIGENQISSYSNALNQFEKTLIPISGDTRNNITIIDPLHHTETHLREPGFKINSKNIQQMQTVVARKVRENDWVILTGSLPPGTPMDFYATLIRQIKQKNAWTVLDSSGDALIHGTEALPEILKINLDELRELTARPLNSVSEIILESKRQVKKGCRFVVVTLGKIGAIGVSNDQGWRTELPRDFQSGVNAVGCGDAFLAGFVAKLRNDNSFKQALVYATACGAVNTLVPGAGRVKLKLVSDMVSSIKITKI